MKFQIYYHKSKTRQYKCEEFEGTLEQVEKYVEFRNKFADECGSGWTYTFEPPTDKVLIVSFDYAGVKYEFMFFRNSKGELDLRAPAVGYPPEIQKLVDNIWAGDISSIL